MADIQPPKLKSPYHIWFVFVFVLLLLLLLFWKGGLDIYLERTLTYKHLGQSSVVSKPWSESAHLFLLLSPKSSHISVTTPQGVWSATGTWSLPTIHYSFLPSLYLISFFLFFYCKVHIFPQYVFI